MERNISEFSRGLHDFHPSQSSDGACSESTKEIHPFTTGRMGIAHHLVLVLTPCGGLLTPPSAPMPMGYAGQRVKSTSARLSTTVERTVPAALRFRTTHDRSQWQQNALRAQTTHVDTTADPAVDGWLLLARAVLSKPPASPPAPDHNMPLQKHTTARATSRHRSQARCATLSVRRLTSHQARNRTKAPSHNREATTEAPTQAPRLRKRLQRLRRLSKTAANGWDHNQMVKHRMLVLFLVLETSASPTDVTEHFEDAHGELHMA